MVAQNTTFIELVPTTNIFKFYDRNKGEIYKNLLFLPRIPIKCSFCDILQHFEHFATFRILGQEK